MAVLDPTDPISQLDSSTDPLMSGSNPSPSMVNPNPNDPNGGNLTANGNNPDGTNPLLALYAPPGGVVTSDAARNPAPAAVSNASTPTTPSSTTDRTPPSTFSQAQDVQNLRDSLNPTNIAEPGAPPNLAQQYQDLRAQPDVSGVKVADLESHLNDINNQKVGLQNELLSFKQSLQGKGSAQGALDNVVSEKEGLVNDKLAAINQDITATSAQLQTRYSVIDNIMKFTQQDYSNAVDQYDREYTQNIRLMSLVKGDQSLANTQQQQQQNDARANLQIMVNQIGKNGLDYSQLSPDQQNTITKLEMQSGLPVGFMENLQVTNPRADIVSTTTRNDGENQYADVLMRNPQTGKLSVESQFLGKAKSPTSITTIGGQRVLLDNQTGNVLKVLGSASGAATVTSGSLSLSKDDIGKGQQNLENARGKDGYADTNLYLGMLDHWTANGGLPQDFMKQYPPKTYLNPSDPLIPAYVKSSLPKTKAASPILK